MIFVLGHHLCLVVLLLLLLLILHDETFHYFHSLQLFLLRRRANSCFGPPLRLVSIERVFSNGKLSVIPTLLLLILHLIYPRYFLVIRALRRVSMAWWRLLSQLLLINLLIYYYGRSHVEHLLNFGCLGMLLLLIVVNSVKQVGIVHVELRDCVLALCERTIITLPIIISIFI